MRCVFTSCFHHVFETSSFSRITPMLRWDRVRIKLISVGNRILWPFGVDVARAVTYVAVRDKIDRSLAGRELTLGRKSRVHFSVEVSAIDICSSVFISKISQNERKSIY